MKLFDELWSDVVEFFETEFLPVAKSFFETFAKTITANGGQVLIQAAQTAVSDAESIGGDGATKLATAKATVVNALETNGVPVVMNAVNLAIEAAVAQMNAAQVKPSEVAQPENQSTGETAAEAAANASTS